MEGVIHARRTCNEKIYSKHFDRSFDDHRGNGHCFGSVRFEQRAQANAPSCGGDERPDTWYQDGNAFVAAGQDDGGAFRFDGIAAARWHHVGSHAR